MRPHEEIDKIEEQDAWQEYLEATRGLDDGRYREVESWAWKRLRTRLGKLKARQQRRAA